MNPRPFKTAYELQDMIVEQARSLHGPWPSGMTMFVFDDAYGWSASISRPASEGDNFYRTCTLDLITKFKVKKKESSRKLEKVDQNLARVNDIVEEVE